MIKDSTYPWSNTRKLTKLHRVLNRVVKIYSAGEERSSLHATRRLSAMLMTPSYLTLAWTNPIQLTSSRQLSLLFTSWYSFIWVRVDGCFPFTTGITNGKSRDYFLIYCPHIEHKLTEENILIFPWIVLLITFHSHECDKHLNSSITSDGTDNDCNSTIGKSNMYKDFIIC